MAEDKQQLASVRHSILLPAEELWTVCSRVVFGVFFVLNLVLWIKGSSAAIPFSTLVALLALWFGISVPLTFVGAYFGFRRRVSGFVLIDSLVFYCCR